MVVDFAEMEKKWQRRWSEEGLERSDIDPNKESFFLIFAYPGVTGYLHVGHMRGYTISDAICRYKRMRGFNVMFPVGTHATGNGAIAFARRVERRDPDTLETLRENGCDSETIAKLADPISVVNYFNEVYLNNYWKRFGFLSDWRRFTCTIYPDYEKFIEWQMIKLNKAGLLMQKPYFAAACPEHGPVAIDASETDLQRGGSAELVEYVALKFKMEDKFLLAATLRPETIFGLTNFWVNPKADYVVAEVGDEKWILSMAGAQKLVEQREDAVIVAHIVPSDLIGTVCIAPYTGKEIPILPSELVDPGVGTGLVMSVPSDAPYDWIGLVDLREHPEKLEGLNVTLESLAKIDPIPIIKTPGWGPLPALEICEKMGIKELSDPKLEEATKEIYKSGFHRGLMTEVAGEYAGMPVEQAKDMIKSLLTESGEAIDFYDLSEEVVCRCGNRVMIKRIPDQWFIDYADRELTDKSKSHAEEMSIFPREYYDNIQGILEWFRERACVRQGNWLGTKFPLDRKWIVEAIADSTLYPVYYLISMYANERLISPENMTEDFFDFVLRDEGGAEEVAEKCGIDSALLLRIRDEVSYWYPLSINLGGKEHMTVHFPVFLMNHVGLLPKKYWPRGIIVNWYITGGGGKISKSKGGAQPIPGAAAKFGVDPLRLFYAHVASLYVDVAWDDDKVEHYKNRMLRLFSIMDELLSAEEKPRSRIDDWLLSRLNERIRRINEAMDVYDIRSLANEVYFELPADLRWYTRRGGAFRGTIESFLETWIRMLTPITPHVAEELWHGLGRKSTVSAERFPEPREDWSNPSAEAEEEYLRGLIEDISQILKVTKITPDKLVITVATDWKMELFYMACQMARSGNRDVGVLIKSAMGMELPGADKKAVLKFAKSLMADLAKMTDDLLDRISSKFDEVGVLSSSADFIASYFGASEVVIQKADDEKRYDPTGKADAAKPRRPSIFAE
ncbi:MAG TPA: leucine--tRNA ligase [Euryarchaeota archaeon]|nr:leucine--tRNA ligase [Euryarchaeota archaeon]